MRKPSLERTLSQPRYHNIPLRRRAGQYWNYCWRSETWRRTMVSSVRARLL